jgi:hypothetical protein
MNPMMQQVGGHPGVAELVAMGARVGEADQHFRMVISFATRSGS